MTAAMGFGAGLRRTGRNVATRAVARGMPPGWCGWRCVPEETPADLERRGGPGTVEVVHAAERFANPLPRNVASVDALPADPDWFSFSFQDVPDRLSGRTALITLRDASVVSFNDPRRDEFWPAVLTRDRRSLTLREVKYRPGHARRLRQMPAAERVPSATWFLERVYENHSHWLTAHLPKLCLLKARGELDDLVLPARRNRVIEASLAMLGLDPKDFRIHDPSRPLAAGTLRLVETDRFRPQLLRPVRDMLGLFPGRPPWRRVFVSRAGARIRRLRNEAELHPMLKRAGFEIVRMETLGFAEQIRLMGETAVLLAPHGAGLTNMMFAQEGADVVEIADLSYPNPNFYALAVAIGLNYWIVHGAFVPEPGRHRLDLDLTVDPEAINEVLDALDR